MTDAQSNRLDMFNLVSEFYTTNQAVIDTVNARTAAFTAHNTNRATILANLSGQTSNTRGAAADKSGAREQLSIIAETVFLPVRAWASVNADQTTRAEFDYSRSSIQQIKDDTIEAFLNHRIAIVNNNLAALADYGITATLVTQLQDALTDYLAFLSAPRGAIVRRSVNTANLRALFQTASAHLRNVVDPLMVTLRATQPDLYKEYRASRIVIDRRGPGNGDDNPPPAPNGLRIAGTVRSQNGNTGIPNALVRAYNVMQGPGAGTMEVFTGADGSYLIAVNHLSEPITIYMEVSAAGYPSQGRNLNVAPGQTYQGEDFNL
jgi:hypothetical protein